MLPIIFNKSSKTLIKRTRNLSTLPIYMDYQATTPVDKRVIKKMLQYFDTDFGNAHSKTHKYGWDSNDAVENARNKVSNLINCDSKEIVFTSGATESNNIAIKGVANFVKNSSNVSNTKDFKNHIITTQIEHKCVLESCRQLSKEGFEITYLPVNKYGLIDIQNLKDSITSKTLLVTIMAVNNEIGSIQPIKEIGNITRNNKIYFHTDAAQAIGKIPIDVKSMNIDLLSISAHKLYGPKGIGALFVNKKPRVKIQSIISGGGQERNIRSGTLATPLIVALGESCELSLKEMNKDYEHIVKLNKLMKDILISNLTHIYFNGSDNYNEQFPGNINVSFAGVEGESLLMSCKDIAMSSGSACTSASLEPSYVLKSIGISEDLAHTSLRIGIGKFTTEQEVIYASNKIIESVNYLRSISPLWDLIQEGVDLKTIKWTEH